jgi:hypothetical protein
MKTSARIVRFFHLLSLVPFLGGIAACIVLNATGHLGQPSEFVLRRHIASDLTWALIVPGMCALVASGIALGALVRKDGTPHSWLIAKLVLGALILGNGFFLIVPRVQHINALVSSANLDLSVAASLQKSEDVLGGINLMIALAAFVLSARRGGGRPSAASTAGNVLTSGVPLGLLLVSCLGCVELRASVVKPAEYLASQPSPGTVYAGSGSPGVVVPFAMTFPSMDALMLFAFEDDPRYRDVELQIMSHEGQRLPRVILYRQDGGGEVHVPPHAPAWLKAMERTDHVLNQVRFLEAEIDYRFEVRPEGLAASLRMHRADGLLVAFQVDERSQERLRASIIAPVGADTQHPTFFPFFFVKSLALVPRGHAEVDVQIDGQHRKPGTLTRLVKGPASYLIRYSQSPLIGRWNEDTTAGLVVHPVSPGTNSLREGESEVELAWNAGHAEISSLTWHRGAGDVRFRFGPAWPDVLAMKPGAVVAGRFSVDVSDDAGVLAGEYRVERRGNAVHIQIHPTEVCQPPVIKGGPWVAHYEWNAVMESSPEGSVNLQAAWKRR